MTRNDSSGTFPTVSRRPWYRRRGRIAAAVVAAGLAAALGIGVPLASSAGTSADSSTSSGTPVHGGDWVYGGQTYGGRTYGGSGQQGGSGGATQQATTAATSSQSKGLVVIDTDQQYEGAEAAGTGMVLTSSGTVLTNNHVIEGATSIKVTVPATGRSYTASVVGSDASADVAVLKLSGASGLSTVTIDKDTRTVGQAVTAVGNAEGRGVLSAASGTLTSLKSSVTTQAEESVSGETLSNMLQTSADVVSGDSGGALLDSQNEVVGMDTAASTGTTPTVAYAIPISSALSVASQIEKGETAGGITVGYPAFLGVEVAADSTNTSFDGGAASQYGGEEGGYGSSTGDQAGAVIQQVIDGTPAASAGMAAGDTITAVNGKAVTSSSGLSEVLSSHTPGQKVTVAWTDSTGTAHTSTVTLAKGPAA